MSSFIGSQLHQLFNSSRDLLREHAAMTAAALPNDAKQSHHNQKRLQACPHQMMPSSRAGCHHRNMRVDDCSGNGISILCYHACECPLLIPWWKHSQHWHCKPGTGRKQRASSCTIHDNSRKLGFTLGASQKPEAVSRKVLLDERLGAGERPRTGDSKSSGDT